MYNQPKKKKIVVKSALDVRERKLIKEWCDWKSKLWLQEQLPSMSGECALNSITKGFLKADTALSTGFQGYYNTLTFW